MLVRAVNKDGGTWIPNIEVNPRKKDQEYTIYIRKEDNPDTMSYKELRDQAVVEMYARKEQSVSKLSEEEFAQYKEKRGLPDIEGVDDILRHLK